MLALTPCHRHLVACPDGTALLVVTYELPRGPEGDRTWATLVLGDTARFAHAERVGWFRLAFAKDAARDVHIHVLGLVLGAIWRREDAALAAASGEDAGA